MLHMTSHQGGALCEQPGKIGPFTESSASSVIGLDRHTPGRQNETRYRNKRDDLASAPTAL